MPGMNTSYGWPISTLEDITVLREVQTETIRKDTLIFHHRISLRMQRNWFVPALLKGKVDSHIVIKFDGR